MLGDVRQDVKEILQFHWLEMTSTRQRTAAMWLWHFACLDFLISTFFPHSYLSSLYVAAILVFILHFNFITTAAVADKAAAIRAR